MNSTNKGSPATEAEIDDILDAGVWDAYDAAEGLSDSVMTSGGRSGAAADSGGKSK